MSDVKIPNFQAVFGGNKITENKSIVKEEAIETKEEITESNTNNIEKISHLNLNSLFEFKEHIFNEIPSTKFEELVESISQNGVIDPIIVREINDSSYEIIAGHNRVRACRLLGMKTIPAIIKDVDDNTAKLIMIDTNLSRRDKLLPSELMKAYSMKMEILKNNFVGQVDPNAESSTESSHTREKLAEQENVSARQLNRYIRLKNLIPELLKCVDIDTIPFVAGTNLSFLNVDDQQTLMSVLNDNPNLKLSVKQSELLKDRKDNLSEQLIIDILTKKSTKPKPKFTGKLKPTITKKYKDKFESDEEFSQLIEKLLENYFSTNLNLSDNNPTS